MKSLLMTPLVVAALLMFVCDTQADGLSSLRLSWKAAKAKACIQIRESYLLKLEELKEQLTKQQNLTAAVQVSNEIDLVSSEGNGDFSAPIRRTYPNNPKLSEIRTAYENAVREAIRPKDEIYAKALVALKERYAKEGNLEAALSVTEELELLEVATRAAEAVVGRFHVSVDDGATIYLNGEEVFVAKINESASPEITLSPDDRLLIRLRNKIAGRRFMIAFQEKGSERVISFKARDFKEISAVEKNDFDPEALERLISSCRETRDVEKPMPFKFDCDSEWLWGEGKSCDIAMIISASLLHPEFGALE